MRTDPPIGCVDLVNRSHKTLDTPLYLASEMRHNDPRLTGTVSHDSLLCISTYFSPCSVSFVLIREYIQYSPPINFRLIIPSDIHLQLIIPSNIHLQCLCSTKNEKKKHNEGNMALRIISILTH